MKGIES